MLKRILSCIILICALIIPLHPTLAAEAELSFTLPNGREDAQGYLNDGNLLTRLTLVNKQSLLIEWEGTIEGLTLHWYEPGGNPTLEWLNSSGNELKTEKPTIDSYRCFYPSADASALRITAVNRSISLCEVEICKKGESPSRVYGDIQSADLLLVLASVTEETVSLGGLLPRYANEQGIKTSILYVSNDYGNLVGENLNALKAMGLDIYPVYLRKEDHNAPSLSRMQQYWKSNELCAQLARYFDIIRPSVIVVADPDDELSRPREQYTAQCMVDYCKKDGFRQSHGYVQKLYSLDVNGTTVIDWTTPAATEGEPTAFELANRGYECYNSQKLYQRELDASTAFELEYSTVGEDAICTDLMENVDTGVFVGYIAPTPLPTFAPTEAPSAEPTAEPTTEPTSEPTQQPSEQPIADFTEPKSTPLSGRMGLYLFIGLIAGAIIFFSLRFIVEKRSKGLATVLTILAVLLMLGAIATMCYSYFMGPSSVGAVEATPAPTAELTQAPATPSAAPVDLNTPAPTAEPTATPDPLAQYFRAEGEPKEVISYDWLNGHWEYKSDILSVIIDRDEYTQDGKPQCRYIAHIRMRNIDSFRTGLASNLANAANLMPPWQLARSYRAVLAITGDNLTQAEKEAKGILIRNGRFYSDYAREDTIAFVGNMDMKIIDKGAMSGTQLLDSGVQNSYSFGPTLVKNGQINENASKHRVAHHANPRCGIGIIEPGHFVAIVCDGRDAARAYNVTMDDFAKMFYELGVTDAYNLDGGSSTAMVFMGENINWHSGADGHQRNWVDALMWGYSQSVPSVLDPVYHNGRGSTYRTDLP